MLLFILFVNIDFVKCNVSQGVLVSGLRPSEYLLIQSSRYVFVFLIEWNKIMMNEWMNEWMNEVTSLCVLACLKKLKHHQYLTLV